MVMFTIGTGVGGGIVLGGELVRGAHGIAAELGHMLTVPDGHQCGCGRLGCIEQYASGSALVRFARAAARQEPHRATALLELAGGEAEAVTGPMVTAAAQGGDPVSAEAFAQVGRWLGTSLADMAQILDPQVLVVGGGVDRGRRPAARPDPPVVHRRPGPAQPAARGRGPPGRAGQHRRRDRRRRPGPADLR